MEQEELIEIVKKEEELNELKLRFANMISHEVRTPLAGILSSVELLEIIHESAPEALKTSSLRHFSRIKEQVSRLSDLMSDVLLLGEIEAGKVKLNQEWVDVAQKIREFIDTTFNKNEPGVKVRFKTWQEPYKFWLDWSLLKRALTNLINNAIKYSIGGQAPELTLYFCSDFLEITVKDYGIGIPESEIQRLFSPFTRASNVSNIEGTGLGLILVKHFVELHEGEVRVWSKEKRGSMFTITIPRE